MLLSWEVPVCVTPQFLCHRPDSAAKKKHIRTSPFILEQLNAHKCYKIKMMPNRYLAWWQGWRSGGPEEILILFIINVPSIVGAAGKLMETRCLFRLEVVELGLCVFGIPAEGHIERFKWTEKRKRQKKIKDRSGLIYGSTGRLNTLNFRRWQLHTRETKNKYQWPKGKGTRHKDSTQFKTFLW